MFNKSKGSSKTEEEYTKLREKMVKEQIRRRGIRNQRILEVMRKVPRHKFVPETQVRYAYNDNPLPIGYNQTISQPYIVALMTERLELDDTSKVLEIGTGSGYQAAVIAEIAEIVYSMEIVEELASSTSRLLDGLGYENIVVKQGNGYLGWSEHAPFDGIILTAAPKEMPQNLIDQLDFDGRMIAPVGGFYQELVLVTKTEKGIDKKNITGVRFVPMVGEDESDR